jgi:phage gp36-like protein
MAYCTQADIEKRISTRNLIAMTDRSGAGVVDSSVVAAAIEAAGGVVDAYIGSRYTLPLAVVPDVLTDIACDLAIYRLYKDQPTEPAKERHDAALAMLKDISAQRADLPIPVETDPAPGRATVLAPTRVFTETSLKGFI